MSAYGKLAAPVRSSQEPLRPRVYALPERVRNDTSDPRAAVLCVPFSQKTEPKLPTKAQELLRVIFNKYVFSALESWRVATVMEERILTSDDVLLH